MARRGLLSIGDLSQDQVSELLERACELAVASDELVKRRRGFVAFASQRDSLRTRLATHRAATLLGLDYEDIYLGREFYADPSRRPDHAEFVGAEFASLKELGCAAFVARVHNQATLRQWAGLDALPLVNACSDSDHPLQALADVLTLIEWFGDIGGLRLCMVGNGTLPVFRSLALIAPKRGVKLTLACPPGFELPSDVLEFSGLDSKTVHSQELAEAIADADVVYADSIAYRMPTDAEATAFKPFRLSQAVLQAAGSNARFMHCLPHSNEIEAELVLSERSLAMRQVAWRVPATAAVLESLL